MPTGLNDLLRHMPTGLNDLLRQAMFSFLNSEFLYETSFDDVSSNVRHVSKTDPLPLTRPGVYAPASSG